MVFAKWAIRSKIRAVSRLFLSEDIHGLEWYDITSEKYLKQISNGDAASPILRVA